MASRPAMESRKPDPRLLQPEEAQGVSSCTWYIWKLLSSIASWNRFNVNWDRSYHR